MAKTSRDEIIAVARDLMRDKGYAGTSMKEVAERVGLLKGSLYSHFPGKEALVPEVLTLTLGQIVKDGALSGDWRADYQTALDGLVDEMSASQRCIGFHLTYGLDNAFPGQRKAVEDFFFALRGHFERVLLQGIEGDLAAALATDTIMMVEGATLWLALFRDDESMRAARAMLLARADSCAEAVPDEGARRLLDHMAGDWRKASLVEKRLARRAVEAEDELMTVRAALAGQIEAESCFR